MALKNMNISFGFRFFACFLALTAIGSLAHAQGPSGAQEGKKTATPTLPTLTTPANAATFNPVPEPSAESLILIGLGCAGLALRLRKRA